MTLFIRKADGTSEPFKKDKLRGSLLRAGADVKAAEEIASAIERELQSNDSTKDIYQKAFARLKKYTKASAARYSLKRAVLDLGPTGFPFEVFVGKIFAAQGYATRTGVVVDGRCATHEVDIVASKKEEKIFGEVKFHSRPGVKSDMQVALYVRARTLDIEEADTTKCRVQGLLITNTKFTINARKYAECVGLRVIDWSYPEKGNLQDLIEETGIHPITCLTSLSSRQKSTLMEEKIVLCTHLIKSPEAMQKLGLSDKKISEITEEAKILCRG